MQSIPKQKRAAATDANDASEPVEDADAYRVLIVEDDRSQAQFAQGVLKGAGIRTELALTAAEALPALESFSPDLLLMDLHLPDASGLELTAQIREHARFSAMPIVFLTGDTDPETEFHVLDGGGDDFLSKPIRPRHLIAAVQSRVRRARELAAKRGSDGPDPDTGLRRRDHVLPLLEQSSGALLLEIQNLAALQERYGYAGVESLLRGAAKRVGATATGPAARLNDSSFLVLGEGDDESQLRALAKRLRDAVGEPLPQEGTQVRLRAAVGWVSGLLPDADGDARLHALEQAVRQARVDTSGLSGSHGIAQEAVDTSATNALAGALRDGRLELAFQPIVAVAGGDESRFQVLLRVRDPDGTLRSAGEVLGGASGEALAQADRWVMGEALAVLADAKTRPSRLFVSQSPQAIAADPAGSGLLESLRSRDIPPEALVIDLRLEDALVHGLALADFCKPLAEAGVGFCLGGFNAAAEATALLRQLPLAYLRLAPGYSDGTTGPALREEMKQIIDRANEAGILVIGSRVETPSVAAAMWMAGVDCIQGNLVQQVGNDLAYDFHHSVL